MAVEPMRRADVDKHIIDSVLAPSLATLHSDLVLARLIRNVTTEAVAQGATSRGDIVKFPKRGAMTAGDKVSGTASEATRYTDTLKSTLTIDKHKEVYFIVEDSGGAFVQVDALSGYSEDAGHALAEAVETDIWALYASASRTLDYKSTGLTSAKLAATRTHTRNDKWISTLPSIAVLGPKAEEDLLIESTIVNHNSVSEVSKDALVEASVARIYGFNMYMSNLAPDITGSAGYENNLFFQPDGMAIAFADMMRADLPIEYQGQGVMMQGLNLEDSDGNPAYSIRMVAGYDIANRGPEVVFDSLYGVKAVETAVLYNVQV